jgi:ATP-dependent Lon protease
MSEQMNELPVVPLRGRSILPGMVTHFDISRSGSTKAVENAMIHKHKLFLVAQKNLDMKEPEQDELYKIGTIAEVKQVMKLKHQVIRVLVVAVSRAQLIQLNKQDGCLMAQVEAVGEIAADSCAAETLEAMSRNLQSVFLRYCEENPKIGNEMARQLFDFQNLEGKIDYVGGHLPMNHQDRQSILESLTLPERYETIMQILSTEVNITQIQNELREKVKEKVEQNQRDYILREQAKLIRKELGEDDSQTEVERFQKKVRKLKAQKQIKTKLKKEIKRYGNMSLNSSESGIIRGYIETLLELPWDKKSQDNEDLKEAQRILDEDHFGLSKVKERMIEFLAVRNLTKKGDSPIICLVGPPGTGKTSIARSVARALNKKYTRISLGGVRDEAEIRGHRKTYVGAMPGRLVNALKNTGVKNPLILLDEVDKMSSDYKGDTAAALLEVLDNEQNAKFRDHYVELPVDLSQVLFITTANSVQTIPRPLLDRLELIEVSSYTENEKAHIAKEHLIAKQRKKNGLKPSQLMITSKALEKMIHSYTREAGVRNLERKIGEICRKAAKEIYLGEKKQVKITRGDLVTYLGNEKYHFDPANEADEVGIVRGLAWTSVGGDTLQIEVNTMPGKGGFHLTGQLGDVMKESAQAGISYIRSISECHGIAKDFFKNHDIHIHIPEGAVPKDGPSAGITMAVAMLSAITGRKVRADAAMTGEITLRGRVLPVGGLKEKILAARSANIKTVYLPKKNKPDIAEISSEITDGIQIIFVEAMEEVLESALR